jgi:4-hydroxy-tetrahydrodipicolinate reductase
MTATTTRRLALIGMGRMGRVLAELAPERGWQVVARIDSSGNDRGRGITAESLAGADVAIEFTAPRATVANVKAAVVARCPIVVGTTGWNDELPALATWVGEHDGALLTAPNFSLGVNAFEQIVALASRLLATAPGFDAHLVETHHAAKKDAPSGTALTLARAGSQSWHGDIPISSVRTGNVPGTHELIFDAPFETIHLTHTARDRRVFAEGALVAAGWLIGRHGVYTMRDVLDTPVEAVGA